MSKKTTQLPLDLMRACRMILIGASILPLVGCEWIRPRVEDAPAILPLGLAAAKPTPLPPSSPEIARPIPAPEVVIARGARVAPLLKKPKVGEEAEEGSYTLNFDDADLGEVAKVILGESLSKNYVISPKVSGRVTLRTVEPLTERQLIPTLEMVLRSNGAVLIEDMGGYRIEPEADATNHGRMGRESGYRLQVIPLKYVGAQEIQTILEPILPAKSLVKVDPLRNLLFLGGSSQDMEKVIETVHVFDVNFLKGMSFGLYPLKNVAVGTIFGELQTLFGGGAGGPLGGALRVLPIERLNAVMALTTQPDTLDDLKSWLDRLDRSNASGGGNLHVYRVQHVDAIQLANTLSQFFGGGSAALSSGAANLAPGLGAATLDSGLSDGGFATGTAGGGSGASSGMSSASTPSSSAGSASTTSGGGASGAGKSGVSGGLSGSAGFGAGQGGATGAFGRSSGVSSGTRGAASPFGGMGGAGANGIRILPDPANNALIIHAPPFEYESIERLIKQLDVMPMQVLVDAMIVEITLDEKLKYGVQWLFQHGDQGGSLFSNAATDLALLTPGFSYALLSKHVKVVIDALASQNKVNVLSSPSLMVMNNQQAVIKIGDQVPIRTSETSSISGLTSPDANRSIVPVTSTIQMRDTGVQLMIRPRVNKGGLVTMDILQQVDDVKKTDSSEIDSPTIAQRQIQSSIAVRDGDTLVLGGLIKESRSGGKTGLPVLKDIPYLGSLFSKSTRESNRTELVVLITPHVASDRDQAMEVTEEFKSRLKGLYSAPGDAAEKPAAPPRADL